MQMKMDDPLSHEWHLTCTALQEAGVDSEQFGLERDWRKRHAMVIRAGEQRVSQTLAQVQRHPEQYECEMLHLDENMVPVVLCDFYGFLDNLRLNLMGHTCLPTIDSATFFVNRLLLNPVAYRQLSSLAWRHLPDSIVTLCDRHNMPLRTHKQDLLGQLQSSEIARNTSHPSDKTKTDRGPMIDLVLCQDAENLAHVLIVTTCFNGQACLGIAKLVTQYMLDKTQHEWIHSYDVRWMLSSTLVEQLEGKQGPPLPDEVFQQRLLHAQQYQSDVKVPPHTSTKPLNPPKAYHAVPLVGLTRSLSSISVAVPQKILSKTLADRYRKMRRNDVDAFVPTATDANGCTILDLDAYLDVDVQELPMLFWHDGKRESLINADQLNDTNWPEKPRFQQLLDYALQWNLGFWLVIFDPSQFLSTVDPIPQPPPRHAQQWPIYQDWDSDYDDH